MLRREAAAEPDPVPRTLFGALALRLRGVAELRAGWERDDDPELCNLVVSAYNDRFPLAVADLELLTDVLIAYLGADRGWIRAMPRDEWRDDVYVAVYRLAGETAAAARSDAPPAARDRLRAALERVAGSKADKDAKIAAADGVRALRC